MKKYIRPAIVQELLEKVCAMCPGACSVAVSLEGAIILSHGGAQNAEFELGSPGVYAASITFDALNKGDVRLLMHDGETDGVSAQGVVEFAAHAFQQIIDMESARRSIADEALSQYRELALLHRSVPVINTSLRMRDVVGALINECQRENYPGELGMIFLSEPGSARFKLAVQFGFQYGANLQAMASSRLFAEVAASGKGEVVDDLGADARWNDEMPNLGSLAVIPLVSPNRTEGMLVLASRDTDMFEATHGRSLSTLASVAGISVSNAFNFEGVQTLMHALLRALAEAIDSRDPFTAGHSERVAQLAVAFAHSLNEAEDSGAFSEQELREIYYAGILHDVGKIGIKEDVLTKDLRLPERRMDVLRARFQLLGQVSDFNWTEAYEKVRAVNRSMTPDKGDLDYIRELGHMSWDEGDDTHPLLYDDELEVLLLEYGNLTVDERNEIQRHPAESERILQHIPMQQGYGRMLTIIRQHHERMDGSGYPDGLEAKDILIQSRIMAIVDIYDAVTQERHYKPACTRSEAVKILRLEADDYKLDPTLTDFFIDNIDGIETVSERIRSAQLTELTELGPMASI